jgi:uncharacterized membrane protein
MIEFTNSLPIILLANSIVAIGLILSQNDSAKDSITTSTSNSTMNPLEKLTWGSLVLQFSLLLIKIKTNDF